MKVNQDLKSYPGSVLVGSASLAAALGMCAFALTETVEAAGCTNACSAFSNYCQVGGENCECKWSFPLNYKCEPKPC